MERSEISPEIIEERIKKIMEIEDEEKNYENINNTINVNKSIAGEDVTKKIINFKSEKTIEFNKELNNRMIKIKITPKKKEQNKMKKKEMGIKKIKLKKMMGEMKIMKMVKIMGEEGLMKKGIQKIKKINWRVLLKL